MEPNTEARRLAVPYLRTSTGDQRDGAEAQLVAIRTWAARAGVELLPARVDELSGATPQADRPGLCAALGDLQEHGPGVVLLIQRRDRLARDAFEAEVIRRAVIKAKGEIVSADGLGNGSEPEAIFARRILDAVSELERSLIGRRKRAANAIKRARGEKLSGSVPYGKRVEAGSKVLAVHPQEAACAALARELRAGGLSLAKVGARLAEAGYHPRSGPRWARMQIARMTADVR